MSDDGWLWPLAAIETLIPPVLAGTPPTAIPEDGYEHPDYDPDDYADRNERARVRWTVGAPDTRGQASLRIRERAARTPLTEGNVDSDAHLYHDGVAFIVQRIPPEQRTIFGEWAYLIDRPTEVGRSWMLCGDRLTYQCCFPTDSEPPHPVPDEQLYASAAHALTLIEDPPAERVRPTIRVPAPSHYEWR